VTTKDDGLALPGATVSIPSVNLSAVTDTEGRYTIEIPARLVTGQTVEVQASSSGARRCPSIRRGFVKWPIRHSCLAGRERHTASSPPTAVLFHSLAAATLDIPGD
jgi:hypothetical protein